MRWDYKVGNQDVTTEFTDRLADGVKNLSLTTHVIQNGVSRFCTKKDHGLQSLIEEVSIDFIIHIQGNLSPMRNEYSGYIKHFCGVLGDNGRADHIELSIDKYGKVYQTFGFSSLEEMTPMCIQMPGLDVALLKGQGKRFKYDSHSSEFGIICAALLGTYDPKRFSGQQTLKELLRKAHKQESISLIEVCRFTP